MRFRSAVFFSQSAQPAGHRFGSRLLLLLMLLIPALAAAEDSKLSEVQRQQIIRVFLAERPFVHRAFPRGKTGIRIEGNKITPSEAEMNQLVAQFGPAAKPGERAQITAVHFVRGGVVFDVNGGPVKRKKWRDRVNVGINGADPSQSSKQASTDDGMYTNSGGSFVFLAIKEDAASLTTDQIKDLLAPVLDFKATSVAEAYQKSLPPVLAEAVKNHHALVGMDKEMVTYALGRPPRRLRETKDGHDIEEWIYGAPPQDVEFIRFIGDKAFSIEDMKVTGEKNVRTEDEVGDLGGTLNASGQKQTRPDSMAAPSEDDRSKAPTLLRPGEKQTAPDAAARDPKPTPTPDQAPPPPDNSPN
jgi:hypothetical protein